MNWISVKDSLPKPFEVVWIYWRDREVLLGCRIYDGQDEFTSEPSDGWYSFADEKCRWANWWQRIDCSNLYRPYPPMIKEERPNE